MAQQPAASNWSPPIFLAPSSQLLGLVDVAPAPSPLAATGSGTHVLVAEIVGGAVAGAVAVAAVASVLSAATAGKVGLALLQPAWSLLASLARKLLPPPRPSRSSSSSFYNQAQDRFSSSARESAIAEDQTAKSSNHNASLHSSARLAHTAAILEEYAIDAERLKSSASKFIQNQASAQASKFVAVTEELLMKELEGIRNSAARRIGKDMDARKESADHDFVHGQTVESKEIVPIDARDEATAASSDATRPSTMTGKTQPINSKSSPSPPAVVPDRGGGAELDEEAGQVVRRPAGEVVEAGAGGMTSARGGPRAAGPEGGSGNRNLGRVRVSMEVSAHKLRFFWLCHAGGAYGGDQDASVGGAAPAEAPPAAATAAPPPTSHHANAPFVALPLTWASYYGHLPRNPTGFEAAGPALSSSSSSRISIQEMPPRPPPPPNPGVNAPSASREYGCPDYGV